MMRTGERARHPDMDTSLSLLQSLQSSDDSKSWEVLNHLYRPMIRNWLARNDVRVDDQEDVVQEVLIHVAKHVAEFRHSGQRGAFRSWMKRVTINRLRNFSRKNANRTLSVGGSDFEKFLEKWADPSSLEANFWRNEYQQSVISYVLNIVKKRFRQNVYQAFYQTAILNEDVETVARELEMTEAAVYTARSRVLRAVRTLKQGILEGNDA